jgi:integrase
MKVLFYIGALTGLRLADCCLLKWDNVSFRNDLIRCIPRKTKKIKRPAIIPMSSKLEDQLKIAFEWKTDNNYILPKVAERYLRNPHGVRKDSMKIFKFSGLDTSEDKGKLQRQYNICRYGFHSFRHSFASIMASNGYNITMLAQILADDTKTLEKYYISIDDKVIKKTFNDIFISGVKTKLISSGSNKEKLLNEINEKLTKASGIKLRQVLNILK